MLDSLPNTIAESYAGHVFIKIWFQ